MPSRSSVAALALVVLVTAASCAVHAQDGAVCDSEYHLTRIATTVTNPPLGAVDIALLPATSQHFQLDCVTIAQAFPPSANAIRECASPPNQRLQLCSTPSSGAGAGVWTCADASQYLTTAFSTVNVGGRSGPYLRLKLTWSSGLTNIACFPRTFDVRLVGLDVPKPGTELGASVAFVIVVALVAAAALAYGFYSLWRVSKRFEHRAEASPGARAAAAEGGAQEAYRAALQALGAPPEFDSLYDEGGGGGGGGGGAPMYGDTDSDSDAGVGAGDEDREMDEGDEHSPLSVARRQDGTTASSRRAVVDMHGGSKQHHDHGARGRLHHAVLDTNEVVVSTQAPVPWYAKELQRESIERSARGTRRRDARLDDDDDDGRDGGDDGHQGDDFGDRGTAGNGRTPDQRSSRQHPARRGQR